MPVGSRAFNAARQQILNPFFSRFYTPVYNAFTAAIMRSYIAAANAVIASYTATLAGLTDPARIAEFQRKLAFQQARIAQINAWFAANGQTP